MMIAGCDWSMTTPAICLYDDHTPFTFDNCKHIFLTSKKSAARSVGNIHGMLMPEYEHDMQRFEIIANWGAQILKAAGVKQVCIEGYSMGSSGKVFNIAENAGLFKYFMYKAGIEYITPAPTTVKKQFTGKGNANKDAMHDALVSRYGVSVAERLNLSASASPVADVVDAFAMVDYYLNK